MTVIIALTYVFINDRYLTWFNKGDERYKRIILAMFVPLHPN